jgi:uncharacterized RDD family membrane protein YckC
MQKNESINQFAGFWIRVGASLIDACVYLPLVGLNMYNLYEIKSLPLQLLIILILAIYKPFMEFRYGATLGKMAVKIKVVNANFQPLTLSQAIVRYSPWLLSQIISFISTVLLYLSPSFHEVSTMAEVGALQNEVFSPFIATTASFLVLVSCIIVAFDSRKQGLHDMLANTFCIYKE